MLRWVGGKDFHKNSQLSVNCGGGGVWHFQSEQLLFDRISKLPALNFQNSHLEFLFKVPPFKAIVVIDQKCNRIIVMYTYIFHP